jgi:3-dehydroshikimate dehydratase
VNGVTLKGLDIHRFCIGVLVNRSSNNLIQHNRISNNYGGSGVMLTGDDGKGNPTSTTTNNNKVLNNLFVDNGDGLELTRGAAFNLVANNLFTSTKANPDHLRVLKFCGAMTMQWSATNLKTILMVCKLTGVSAITSPITN